MVPAPPSQHTPVQTAGIGQPVDVADDAATDGRRQVAVAKLPDAVPAAVTTSKLCPPSVKPLMRGGREVPPAVKLPSVLAAPADCHHVVLRAWGDPADLDLDGAERIVDQFPITVSVLRHPRHPAATCPGW